VSVAPLLIVTVLSALYSAALLLKLVKPNRVLGWHLPSGKEDDEALWYRLNRYFGAHFLVSNLIVIGWIAFHTYTGVLPLTQGSSGTIIAWVLFALGFIISTARTFRLQKELVSQERTE
jgi:intracellular septation protein A